MSETTPITFSFKQKPQEAIDYLNSKGYQISFDYNDIRPEVHKRAFTVAKITRADLLNDVFTSLDEAIKNGVRFEDWKNNLKPTLQKKGWWGQTSVTNPNNGEKKNIYVGARRLRTIFRTNMRVAFHVARHNKQRKLTQSIYWRYVSRNLPNRRESHAAMHGTILHRDHDWWKVNYPPNGWNCRCYVQALSKATVKREGYTISKSTSRPVIASKDWLGNPAIGTNIGKLMQVRLQDMQQLAVLKPNPELDTLSEAQLKARFYQKLKIKPGDMFIDKIGDPMIIDDKLFQSFSGASKLRKSQRHLYIDEFANNISSPDEIYLQTEKMHSGKTRVVKKMFRYFEDATGKKRGLMSVFKYETDKTIGVTIYPITETSKTELKRTGKRIYKKRD